MLHRTLLPILALASTAFASDRWIALRTTNFELFTQADEKDGREALKFFEEVRRAFTDNLGLHLPNNKPVTIIAFRDLEEFSRYRPHDNVAAYTLSFPVRDYIVMQDLNPAHYSVALHEFTHVMIEQAGIKLPLWLNEGFAELYATLTPVGRNIRVGRVIDGRLQTARAGLLDLHEVFNADRSSLLYRENDRIGTFYAESWILVHMLKFSEDYGPRFERFLEAIGRGESSETALQVTYGKTIDQIFRDLQTYVHAPKYREGIIKARLDKSIAEPKQEHLDQVSMAILLASIEARGPRRPFAINTLKDLATANPQNPTPVEALAWLELTGSNPTLSIPYVRRAIQMGTRDANLCYQFAVRLRAALPQTDYLAAMRRALEIEPEMDQAQEQLAEYAFNHHDYKETVARLHAVKKLGKGNAFAYYHMLSAAAFQTGDLEEAKSARARAETFASTAEQKRQLDELRRIEDSR